MAPVLQNSDSSIITDDHVTWMATSLPLAALVSVPMFSYVSDAFGRKSGIILLSTLSLISWTLKLFAINPAGLICARVLAGFASGGCFIVVPVYVKEISEDSLRGVLGSMLMMACNLGVIIVYMLGMLVPYCVNQGVYFGIALIHIILFSFMPESPSFLVQRNDENVAAKKAVAWLRNIDKNDKRVDEEIRKLSEEKSLFSEAPVIKLRNILQDKVIFRPLLICTVLIAVQTLSGCFAVVNYAAAILSKAGTNWSPNVLALFVGALQLAGSVVATASVEKLGRTILLTSSCIVISVCMAILATCLLSPSSSLPDWLPVLAVCLCIFSYGAGLAPVPFVIMAEVFSFQLRARLVGAVMILSWLDSTLTVLLFRSLATMFGEHVVFYGFATIVAFGAVFTIVVVPETKGRTLGEIQN